MNSHDSTNIGNEDFMSKHKTTKDIAHNVMVEEEKIRSPVFTAPLSIDNNSDVDYKAPNLVQRLLSLLAKARPGSDLTRFQVPPLFNLPKSQLQCYGESVYCSGSDLLSKCAAGETAVERFVSVVAWSISMTRPLMFGVAPFNPVIGETHHVSKGTLNVLLEQVSHHPPVTALHGTDEMNNIETLWCHNPVPKFHGSYIETEIQGRRQLKLLNHREKYTMNSPNLVIRFFPIPRVDWLGNVNIKCEESGLEAELCFKGGYSIFGRANNRSIEGKIFNSSSSKIIYKINGHWDKIIKIKDCADGEQRVIYNAKETITGLKTPILKDLNSIRQTESTIVWAELSQAILEKSWEKASKSKNEIEVRERKMAKEREANGEKWLPQHFSLNFSKDNGWEISPTHNFIPQAPIVVPL